MGILPWANGTWVFHMHTCFGGFLEALNARAICYHAFRIISPIRYSKSLLTCGQ